MDLNNFDAELRENICALLIRNELRKGIPAFGVAVKVVHDGLRSLSWQQRFVYLDEMVPLLRKHGYMAGPNFH